MNQPCVIVPYRSDGGQRDRLLRWTLAQWGRDHPSWGTVQGFSPVGAFNRSAAILDGAKRTTADVLVIADGDCYVDPAEAIANLDAGWAVPHRLLHRLSPESTERVLAGEDWRGLPLSTDNARDRRPYVGNECGTMVVVRREVLEDVIPDPNYEGWNFEDASWALALNTLVGKPWRGTADLVHLYHSPPPRLNRRVGSREGERHHVRYQSARGRPERMRPLIDAARERAVELGVL